MLFEDDPSEMTPEQRLAEIASILAVGYLRLRRHDSAPFTENPLDCSGPPMAVWRCGWRNQVHSHPENGMLGAVGEVAE
jgi:hypothetical protein